MLESSVSFWSFNPLLASGDLSPRAAMRFARSVGFQGFEMVDLYWARGEERLRQAQALKEAAAQEAISISCYTIHNDLALFEEGPLKALVDRMLSDVELGTRLGVRVMRVESTPGPAGRYSDRSFEDCLVPVAKGLKAVARRAAQSGIRVGLENHGRFVGSSQRVAAVIDAVGEPNFGSCLDIGNFLVVDEDPLSAVARLAPAAVHVHVKDFHLFETDPGDGAFRTNAGRYLRGAVLGEGVVDVFKCLDVLVKAGYTGWLSHEFEGRENLFYAIARARKNLASITCRLPITA